MLKLKAAVTSLLFIIYTFYSCAQGLLVLLPRYRPFEDYMLRMWGHVSLFILGIKVEVQGIENVPQKGAIYLFNHTSFIDIVAISANIKTPLRFGAKEELFTVPFLGVFLRAGRYLMIARGRREEVVKVYKSAEVRFRNGESFILAPEGSRQHTEQLAEFKSGPFIFAIEAGVPVVPVVVQGACDLMPKNSYLINAGAWSSTVHIKILPAIETTNYNYDTRRDLVELVRGKMASTLRDMQKEAGIPEAKQVEVSTG